MKRLGLFLLCLTGITVSAFAQTISVKVNEKGKAGYVDANGMEILPCKYEATYPFENGKGKVMKGKKYGLVDKSGSFVVQPKWDEMEYDADNNLYRVKSGKNYGLLDGNGQLLVKAQYLYISPFNCYGKALVAKGGKSLQDTSNKKNYFLGSAFGIINVDGSESIPAKYKGLYEFSFTTTDNPFKEGKRMEWKKWYIGDTLATDCKYLGFDKKGASIYYAGILNAQGEIVVPLKTAEWLFKPCNGMVRWYSNVNKKKFSIGYYNISAKKNLKLQTKEGQVTSADYWTHTDFMDDIAAVSVDGVWNFYNREGSVLKSGYKNIYKGTTCGLWQAKKSDGSIDYFNVSGEPVFEDSGYTGIFFPRDYQGTDFSLIGAEKGGKWGLINKENKMIIPFEYEQVNDCRYGCVQVKNNGKWGLVSLQNQTIVPLDYVGLGAVMKENPTTVCVNKADKLWYIYNVKQKKEVGKGYTSVGYFNDGLAWARPADMKVENNTLYRALSDGEDPESENFGYVIDESGQELISAPVPTKKMTEICEWMKRTGYHVLTPMETRRLLLKLSVHQRHYPMDEKISESEWDY